MKPRRTGTVPSCHRISVSEAFHSGYFKESGRLVAAEIPAHVEHVRYVQTGEPDDAAVVVAECPFTGKGYPEGVVRVEPFSEGNLCRGAPVVGGVAARRKLFRTSVDRQEGIVRKLVLDEGLPSFDISALHTVIQRIEHPGRIGIFKRIRRRQDYGGRIGLLLCTQASH